MSSSIKAIVIGFVLLLSAGSAALADEYYSINTNVALYVAWTEDNSGHLQGQIEYVSLSPGATAMSTGSGQIRGIRSRSDVTIISGSRIFGGATFTGHLSFGKLTLVVPTSNGPEEIVLHSGTFADFQKAESAFRSAANSNDNHAQLASAVSAAAQHINAGVSSVDQGVKELVWLSQNQSPGSLQEKYSALWQELESKASDEQDAARVEPMTCVQKGKVEFAAGTVNYEAAAFANLDAQYATLTYQYNAANKRILRGISEIQLWAPVYDQTAQAYQSSIGKAYGGKIINSLLSKIVYGREAIRRTIAELAASKAVVEQYDRHAKDEDATAQELSKSLVCEDN